MLTLENISKIYYDGTLARRELFRIENVNMTIESGKTTTLLGKSGSGKSTISSIVAGILRQTSGRILLDGQEIRMPYSKEVRHQIQMIFQHPQNSFNPKWKLYDSLAEPYRLSGKTCNEEIILKSLENLGLHKSHLSRYGWQLSGGELQRAALARVRTMEPRLIILDEPTSMLDCVSQAQIMGFLKEYQDSLNITYLLITHDVRLAELVSHRIYTIEEGVVSDYEG